MRYISTWQHIVMRKARIKDSAGRTRGSYKCATDSHNKTCVFSSALEYTQDLILHNHSKREQVWIQVFFKWCNNERECGRMVGVLISELMRVRATNMDEYRIYIYIYIDFRLYIKILFFWNFKKKSDGFWWSLWWGCQVFAGCTVASASYKL